MMAATMAVPKQLTPNTHNELLDANTKTVIRMCKIKRGDDELVQPKVVADIPDRDLPVFLRLPALPALYSDTSPNGDQEKFNKSPEQAVNSFTLIRGCKFRTSSAECLISRKIRRKRLTFLKDAQGSFDRCIQLC